MHCTAVTAYYTRIAPLVYTPIKEYNITIQITLVVHLCGTFNAMPTHHDARRPG